MASDVVGLFIVLITFILARMMAMGEPVEESAYLEHKDIHEESSVNGITEAIRRMVNDPHARIEMEIPRIERFPIERPVIERFPIEEPEFESISFEKPVYERR